jgi:ubiquinol-cytochrome c reductase cytochrome c1 subunit
MMMKRISFAVVGLALSLGFGTAFAEGAKEPEAQSWPWHGVFGHFDAVQLQRGYQVYKEVCAACHGMNLVAFRNLGDPGGPSFSEAQVKALAATVQVPDLDDKGEPTTRPGTPPDRFPSAFANEKAARAANGGAVPPDLSVITKAREGHEDYIYALLLGYAEPPADVKARMAPGTYYNHFAPNQTIAMPPPLTTDGQVTYADGQPAATKVQMAKDVVAFLTWAAEPKMEERKAMGVKVIIFLFVLSVLLYFAYRHLWRDVDH